MDQWLVTDARASSDAQFAAITNTHADSVLIA
jgi:hypothetical protein